jgi:anti-sigma regulatory factor (Ser/Thr protein kinase)
MNSCVLTGLHTSEAFDINKDGDVKGVAMTKHDFLKLTLPNDLAYLNIAQFCVREAARRFGFEENELYKLELAVEEAIANVVHHAFEAGEAGSFDIICERLSRGIGISIKEKGLPFDPNRLPLYSRPDSIDELSPAGLGTFLMKEMMDEASYHNLGSEGKELHLVKYLKSKNIAEYFSASDLVPYQENTPESPGGLEKMDYVVRLMEPHEAIEISRGAYRSHGYTFFDETIYYPDHIVDLNNTGELISVVAVTKDHKFMGHAGLHYPYLGARIAELTYVFVDPKYRSQGCMNRMCELLFSTPKKFELTGVYSFAVTNHIYSQKTMFGHGINDCGIELATSPATWVFKGMSGDVSQRMTVVLSFKYLTEPVPLVLYPPPHHREMIERLYRNIDAQHSYAKPATSKARFVDTNSIVETNIYVSEGNAEIFIIRYGDDVMGLIKGTLRDLCLRQVAAINLFLNLEDPLTYFLAEEFEEIGFFFSGILPATKAGDALILQFLNNVQFDYSKVVLCTDVAKEILAYTKTCDPNS